MVPLQQQCQFWSKDGSGEVTEVLLQFVTREKSGEIAALLPPCEMQGRMSPVHEDEGQFFLLLLSGPSSLQCAWPGPQGLRLGLLVGFFL